MIDGFMDLAFGTTRIYKNIGKIKKKHMQFLGIKGSHVFCLYYLLKVDGGLTPGELCRYCYEDKAGISRILKEMEEMELVHLDSCSGARRYRTKVYLTEKGRRKAEDMHFMLDYANAAVFRGLSEEEQEILQRALMRTADNLDAILEARPSEEDRKIIRQFSERQSRNTDIEEGE